MNLCLQVAHYFVTSADTARLRRELQQLLGKRRELQKKLGKAQEAVSKAEAALARQQEQLRELCSGALSQQQRQQLQQDLATIEGGFGREGRYVDARNQQVGPGNLPSSCACACACWLLMLC